MVVMSEKVLLCWALAAALMERRKDADSAAEME